MIDLRNKPKSIKGLDKKGDEFTLEKAALYIFMTGNSSVSLDALVFHRQPKPHASCDNRPDGSSCCKDPYHSAACLCADKPMLFSWLFRLVNNNLCNGPCYPASQIASDRDCTSLWSSYTAWKETLGRPFESPYEVSVL